MQSRQPGKHKARVATTVAGPAAEHRRASPNRTRRFSPRRLRSRLCAGGLVLLVLAAAEVGSAAGAQDSPGFALDDALRATLASNPDIRLAVQQVAAARGAWLTSGAVFDLQLQSSGTAARVHATDPRDGAAAIQKQLSYGAALQRLFRNGIEVRPDLALTRTSLSTFPGAATSNAASVGATVTIPLLRDRGGAVSTAAERAAGHDYEAGLLNLQHTTAQQALVTAIAYWDYLAAQRRLEVFEASEQRAQSTADQTRVLVEAEERTSADLTQILGNRAAKTVTRISSEQALVEARQQLGLAIGLPASELAGIPRAATPFPTVSPEEAAPGVAPPEPVRPAPRQRADLAAAEQDLEAARARLAGARNELKPNLDLVLGSGYSATEAGQGFGEFFAPIYRHGPKLNATVRLAYDFAPANSRARGRLLQSAAAYEQQRILKDDLERRIASGVAVALEALAHGAAAVRQSQDAVRLSEATVQAELRKFELGVSTLFDVIQAQDGLTSAQLSQIQSERTYAVAIATLRFQTGTLLRDDARDGPVVEVSSLLAPP